MTPQTPPTVGRIVHFVLPESSPRAGEERAAIITGAWDGSPHANLCVFLDQPNDVADAADTFHPFGRAWSAEYSTETQPGTWHYCQDETTAPQPPAEIVPTEQAEQASAD